MRVGKRGKLRVGKRVGYGCEKGEWSRVGKRGVGKGEGLRVGKGGRVKGRKRWKG